MAAAVAAGGEQLQKAIVIVVHPGTTEGISSLVHRRAGGHLCKSAVAVIVIKRVDRPGEVCRVNAGFIRHKQIQKSIVVVIAPRAGNGMIADIKPTGWAIGDDRAGDAREGAVPIVSIKNV